MKKAIFLDRDGVINIDKNYVYKIEDFIFTKGALESLKSLQKDGFLLFIVTNQSGIGRGYYTKEDYEKLTNWMLQRFRENEIFITKVYHCPHSPEDNCDCRKPKPGMLLSAIKEFNLNPNTSWMIGDKKSDIKAALNAGVKNSIYIGKEKLDLKHNCLTLKEAKSIILGDEDDMCI